jgi:hypothetical protein
MSTLDPLSRDRTQDLSRHLDTDAGPPTQPATRVAVPPPPLPEYPDHASALIANAVKAATSGAPQAPHMLLAMNVKGADVEYTTRDMPIQQRLDAFKESATPTFHTKDGDVQVGIPFRMVPDEAVMRSKDPRAQPFIQRELVARAHAGELAVVAGRAGLDRSQISDLASGRGTPENIRRVAQALIDAGKLPPGDPADVGARVRVMMCDYGVGLDCAGFVQQAFLASRATTRAEAGLRPASSENLQGLAGRGFNRVPLSDARAGDLFILKPPPHETTGHTTIVRDVRMADATEAEALAKADARWGHPDPAKVQRFELDSSWGNGANPRNGGVQRQVFWHDSTSGQWMHQVGRTWFVEPTPYFNHAIDGVYRPTKEH